MGRNGASAPSLKDGQDEPIVPESEDPAVGARRLKIELPEETAGIIDARIAAGRNASESEVIREALERLAEQDAPLEEWVRTEMAAAYDEWKANPTGGLTIDEVREHLDKAREERQSRA